MLSSVSSAWSLTMLLKEAHSVVGEEDDDNIGDLMSVLRAKILGEAL